MRARFGVNYTFQNTEFGLKLRTGNLQDQQGPHLTLGGNNTEFGLYSVGFEKAYFKLNYNSFQLSLGKFDFPFKTQSEIFWNENVYPEGVAACFQILPKDRLSINVSHFIINSINTGFNSDAYLQALQISSQGILNNWSSYIGLYYFKNLSLIPDQYSNDLDYTILNAGISWTLSKKKDIIIGIEGFVNLKNYDSNPNVSSNLKNDKKGVCLNVQLGKLKNKGDHTFHLYLAHINRFAIVDYFAQNDWARWDYSSAGSSGSRLSNFKGIELRYGYALEENVTLIFRGYWVEQLKTNDQYLEKGARVRLDLNASIF
jgi:hypothetical protein